MTTIKATPSSSGLVMLAAGLGALGMLLGGCGGVADPTDAPFAEETGSAADELSSDNGLSTNGLSTNGLSTNGLSTNGLSTNGLSTNGLSTNGFSAWFLGQAAGTAYTNMVMTYVVRCAVPAWQSRTAVINGVTYTWQGLLGLAPTWASGGPIPTVEQQLVSACLAAHVNKYGIQMPISVRGFQANGAEIPVSWRENIDFPSHEGCFFGNLFNGAGVLVGYDNGPLLNGWASARACVLDAGVPGVCPPMINTATLCSDMCTRPSSSDPWQSCTYEGAAYRPISTLLRWQDLFKCGDGVCQLTESCYSASTQLGCQADCGACP